MDEIRDSMGIAADPNNPFYQPPSTGELVTRALAGAIPAMIRPGQIPIGNRLLAGGAGAAGGMAGGISEALANKRLDPIARQLAINMAAGKAAQGITVPIPGTPEQTVPIVWPPDDHNPQSENTPSTLTIPGKPATSRAPQSQYELLANAPDDKTRAALMVAGNLERFYDNPLPRAQLEHTQLQNQVIPLQMEKMRAEIADLLGGSGQATNLPNKIALELSKDPQTGKVDYANAEEVLKRLRTNPQGPEGRIFDYYAEKERTGKADPAMERAIKNYQGTLQSLREAAGHGTGAGTEAGRVEVRRSPEAAQAAANIARGSAEGSTQGRPLDPGTAKSISELESALRQVSNIRDNQSDAFLGPIKGRDDTFAARRQIGSYIQSPVGEKEVVFRQSLADVSDMLLRARSGAQINEGEYARLKNMLPKATDEPKVFKAGLDRFDKELKATVKKKMELGITPRAQLPPVLPPSPVMSEEEYLKAMQAR